MSLLNPLALLWLVVAAPVILMYFLKLKRRKVPVASTWLWTRSVQDIRVNAPFQRLRKSLLLILQLLLILLAAFALGDPIGRSSPPEEKRWAFLIDRSASMQMKDVKPSRLEKARETALELLRACGPRDEVMVVAFSTRASVMTPLTSDRAAIERAIAAIEPADTVTRIQEAVRIAASAVQPYKNREIVILSDGRFETIQGSAEDLALRYVPIGGEPRNASVSAVEVKKPLRADDPWTVFAQVDLFHKEAIEIPVELHVNGQLRGVKKVKVPANSNAAVLFEINKPLPEVVQVKLDLDDDLEADNRGWAVARLQGLKVLLLSSGNFFLDIAMANLPDTEAFKTDDLSKSSLGDFDVVVLDGAVPEALPEGRYLILGAVPKWEGIKEEGTAEFPAVMDWERRHPVARMVNFANLSVKSSPRLSLPGFATPVVEGPEGVPLVFSWEKGRTRAVVVPFKLLESDWPLRLSFPLFVANAFDWLREEDKAQSHPGDALRIRLSESETEVEVSGPGGAKQKLTGEPGRDVVYGDTDRCGLYSIKRKERTEAVALNLFDPRESSGIVAKELRTSGGKVSATAALPPVIRPYWRWLALAVLAVLLFEWYVYHRRIEI